MNFGNTTSHVKLFFRKILAFSASFSDLVLSNNKLLIASARFSGLSGGTKIPVSLCVTNSGIPPTFVATTGTFKKKASQSNYSINNAFPIFLNLIFSHSTVVIKIFKFLNDFLYIVCIYILL